MSTPSPTSPAPAPFAGQPDFAAAAILGSMITVAHTEHGGIPFLSLPKDAAVTSLERLLDAPSRARGDTKFADVGHFCAAVKRHWSTASSSLYGLINESPTFVAIFDDVLDAKTGGWRQHRATYACPLSKEWQIWKGRDGVQMKQADFAQFIEDNAPDCSSPDSATMIEVARTLEAKKGVNFASGIRLSTGQTEFTYEETISGTAGKGQLQIPEVFDISIPVLVGVDPYVVQARLRYRIAEGGKLTMWYDLVRPHKIIEHAVQDVWKKIAADTGFEIYRVQDIPAPLTPIA